METLLEWLSKYSLPVVMLIALGAIFLVLIRYIMEKALDNRFKQYEKEIALRLERRSRFEEKLLLDQYLLVTDLFHRIGQIAKDVNRSRKGFPVEGLMRGNDLVPLSGILDELNFKRYLIGSRFHDLLRSHCDQVLKLANATSQEHPQVVTEYFQLIDEFNRIATEEFGIDNIQRKFK